MKTWLGLLLVLFVVTSGSTAYGFSARPETGKTELLIYSVNGEPLGTIRNSLVDPEGDIVFVILALGTEPQESQREIIVPIRAFSLQEKGSVIVLHMSSEELAAAPEFHFSDLSDPSFGERVYGFYGQTPVWKERDVKRTRYREEMSSPI